MSLRLNCFFAHLFVLQTVAPYALQQIAQTRNERVFLNSDMHRLSVAQVERFLSHFVDQNSLCLKRGTSRFHQERTTHSSGRSFSCRFYSVSGAREWN